jgi:GGDEF domain-containing protein
VADRLQRAVRPGDTLARFAGDEFVILAEELTDAAQADALAVRVTALLAERFIVDGRPIDVSASVGIAYSGPWRRGA